MPLGTPDTLNTFLLAGYRLEAFAPEEIGDEVDVAIRTWWFRDNPKATQQVGRAHPGPVDLAFKLNGPDALDVVQFLRRMAYDRKEVPFTWADHVNLRGRIKNVRTRTTQHVVSVQLSFHPTQDLNRDKGTSAALTTTIDHTQTMLDALDDLSSLALAIQGLIDQVEGVVNAALSPVTTFLAAVDTVTSMLNSAVAEFTDIASMPFQLVGQIGQTIDGALQTYGSARSAITDLVIAPAAPLVTGTAAWLTDGWGLSALAGMDDAESSLNIIQAQLQPPPQSYLVQDGDTLQSIADAYAVTLGDLLQLNPGLTEQTLAPGITVLVPNV